jgi:hypothetical protein
VGVSPLVKMAGYAPTVAQLNAKPAAQRRISMTGSRHVGWLRSRSGVTYRLWKSGSKPTYTSGLAPVATFTGGCTAAVLSPRPTILWMYAGPHVPRGHSSSCVADGRRSVLRANYERHAIHGFASDDELCAVTMLLSLEVLLRPNHPSSCARDYCSDKRVAVGRCSKWVGGGAYRGIGIVPTLSPHHRLAYVCSVRTIGIACVHVGGVGRVTAIGSTGLRMFADFRARSAQTSVGSVAVIHRRVAEACGGARATA